MNRWIDRCCRLIEALMVLMLAVMVVLVFGNVVMRYAFDSGLTISEELSRWLFIWVTFLGAVVALKENAHLGTDMLITRLPPALQRLCLAIAQALMLFVTWLLFSGALAQARINIDVEAPVSGLPTWIFYASGVVFATLTGLLLLRELGRTLTGRVGRDELVRVQESEDLAQVEALHLDRSGTYKS